MSSVTNRVKEIKQPRGGYLNPSQFNVRVIQDYNGLNEHENIPPNLMGLVVDYLTRFNMGDTPKSAFHISWMGAMNAANRFHQRSALRQARSFLRHIKGNDSQSIINACKLVTFDTWYRNPMGARQALRADEVNPDMETIENIKIMVQRSIKFWDEYGPILEDEFTFGPKGYTKTVNAGDGDYLTADTMWDFKVSKYKLTNMQTLQLLMYWIMGQHSGQPIYKRIKKIGAYNPRLNLVYLLDINEVPKDVISEVEKDVICY